MSDSTENTDGSTDAPANAGEAAPSVENPRVRFQGIVESAPPEEGDLAAKDDFTGYEGAYRPEAVSASDWNTIGAQVQLASRVTAVFIIFLVIVGWPLGDYLAHVSRSGSSEGWSFRASLPDGALLFGFVVSALVFFCGYIASRLLMMMTAAESIATAAQQFIQPDQSAVYNVNAVGAVVRGQMDAINTGIDDALIRLASVEAMIRRHVEAIENAGLAIEASASGAVDRVADERSRLIDLTENLNAQADAFATAIAEKAQASIEALHSAGNFTEEAEANLDERLGRLEGAAQRALHSFESLRDALHAADETVRNSASSITSSSEEAKKASDTAAKLSDAAADAAARNAANVGMAARRAVEETRAAVDEAIERADAESKRAADKAVEFTHRESERITSATNKALDDVKASSKNAIAAAAEDARKTTQAADQVTDAAKKTAQAAAKISADIAQASKAAQKTASEAVAVSQRTDAQTEARNKALQEARAALEAENKRLEALIGEQRTRADKLADAIAKQTERLSKLAEAQLREQEAAARLAETQIALEAKAPAAAASLPPVESGSQAGTHPRAAPAYGETNVLNLRQSTEDQAAKTARAPRKSSGRIASAGAKLNQLADDIASPHSSKNSSARAPGNKVAGATGGARKNKNRSSAEPSTQRNKTNVSWREILDATDGADPLNLGKTARAPDVGRQTEAVQQTTKRSDQRAPATSNTESAIDIIQYLQEFTFALETRLYGEPPPALLERFERGDRNVFANRLLRLNEADVKRRIRSESGRDKAFEHGIHEFLQGFERLLEDATTSETADEELEEYLSSPLGRVYLLIGATVGYFA